VHFIRALVCVCMSGNILLTMRDGSGGEAGERGVCQYKNVNINLFVC
jgi:hypothetical protein